MPNYTIGTESGNITTANTGDYPYYEYTTPYYEMPQQPVVIPTPIFYYPNEYYDWKWGIPKENNKKGGENMRYLYEVILVNPKNDIYFDTKVIARSETSALMTAYNAVPTLFGKDVDFDDLKTSCRVLMEWKKEKSLKKAIETIKEAVE